VHGHTTVSSVGLGNQTLGLENSRLARWTMYALMAFPIVDFGLRFGHLHPLGVLWDKVALTILFVLAVSRYLTGHRPTWFRWHKFALGFILFGFALMFSGLAEPITAIQGFRIDIYYILFAFLIPFVVEAKDVPKLLHIGAMVAILIGISGVYQYVVKVPIPNGWADVHETVRTRVFSVLESPNELGSYMALNIPIIVGLAIYEQNRVRKWLYILGIPFCGATLLFTFTRGAWAALVLAILIMAVLFERRLFIALLVFGVIAFFLPAIHHRIADLFSPVYWLKASQSGRLYRWNMAFDKMSTDPLFGVGVGRFGGAVASLYHGGLYSDNYYAKTLGETGLVGLTLFIAMHLSLFRELFKKTIRSTQGRMKYVLIGGVTGLLAVLIHNVIENVFEYAPMAIAYFIYATLFLIWGYSIHRQESTKGALVEEAQHETT
jgi:O-antigen ligase